MIQFAIGCAVGFLVTLMMIASNMVGTRDECRAAAPGYDCDLGWVVGEAF